jgi:hypothetical protein
MLFSVSQAEPRPIWGIRGISHPAAVFFGLVTALGWLVVGRRTLAALVMVVPFASVALKPETDRRARARLPQVSLDPGPTLVPDSVTVTHRREGGPRWRPDRAGVIYYLLTAAAVGFAAREWGASWLLTIAAAVSIGLLCTILT